MKYDAKRHAYPNIARSFHPHLSDFFRSSRRNGISKRRVKAQKIRLKIMHYLCLSERSSLMRNYVKERAIV